MNENTVPATLVDVCHDIESLNFIAKVGVASSFRRFDSAVAGQPEASRLLSLMRGNQELAALRDHLYALLRVAPEPGFAHPHDIAIAVYLRTIDIVDGVEALNISREVMRGTGLWWAVKLAEMLLEGSATATVRSRVDTSAAGVRFNFSGRARLVEVKIGKGGRYVLLNASVHVSSATRNQPAPSVVVLVGREVRVGNTSGGSAQQRLTLVGNRY